MIEMEPIQYGKYQNRLSLRNKAGRQIWRIVYLLFFRPFSLPQLNFWRLFLLRLFGAKIGSGSKVHSSARFWAPWNLEIGQRTVIGPSSECYNPDKIILGNKVSVSQNAYLCTASHDITKKEHPLITEPICIGDYAWIAAGAFVAMGVTVGEGGVVGARAVVIKDVAPWAVVAGNPARFLKHRTMDPAC